MLEGDLDFILSEFGVLVSASGGESFRALFDVGQGQFDKPGEPPTIINMPMLLCQESDLGTLRRDDVVSIESKGTFYIDSIEPDGTGTAKLILRRHEYVS